MHLCFLGYYNPVVEAALTSLFGSAIGGALFLVSVLMGVFFWVIRERRKDSEMMEEAKKMRHGRRRGVGAEESEAFKSGLI